MPAFARSSLSSPQRRYTIGNEIEKLVLTGIAAINATGNALNNSIAGNAAANIIDGKGGADAMNGQGGDDTYVVDNAGDTITELAGGGIDKVNSSISYTLGNEVEKLVLTGSGAINATGNALANSIAGNSAANVIDGKSGADILIGQGGNDSFVFSNGLGASNIDHIVDFTVGQDSIRLAKVIFAGLAVGALPASAFKDLASSAIDADDRILYNHTTGALSYGSGAAAAVQFAVLDNHALIGAGDFVVV